MPKGFACECGKFHEFCAYVYAHWNIELVHTCTPGCGAKHGLRAGHTYLLAPVKVRTKKSLKKK